MKFVVSSAALSARLSTLGRVIVQKNTIPILDCFCVEIVGDKMVITASDNDTTIVTRLELNEADADVRFAVNAKTLQDAIKEIPEQPLSFYLNTETLELTVEYQNGQYKLMAQSAEQYPVPVFQEPDCIEVTVATPLLAAGLQRASVAAANDVLRPQLNCICFDIREHSLSMVASNGNHLAMTRVALPEMENEGVFLLNTRPASILRSILAKDSEESVKAVLGHRGARFETNDYSMTCRLVEGNYPNYRSVIPQNNTNVVTINRPALISVLRRVMVFANPSSVLIKFRLEANEMMVSSQDLDFGKSADENLLCEYNGNPMRIAFKGSTLLDLIQNIEGDEIKILLADPGRAGLIVPVEQKEEEEVVMLLMPSVYND